MKLVKVISGLTLIINILMTTGCLYDSSSSHNKALSDIEDNNYREKFVVGTTTKKDVITMIGPPENARDLNGIASDIWVYSYKSNVSALPLFPPIPVSVDKNKRIALTFTQGGILKSVTYSE